MFMRLLEPPTAFDHGAGRCGLHRAMAPRFRGDRMRAVPHADAARPALLRSLPSLNQANANLFSDLLVHNMGANLADGVSQGTAGAGDEFRTAPLWGLGQRIFLLHDGRSTDLVDAIKQHASRGSEANDVIRIFQRSLSPQQQQDLLNFLRSL